MSADTLRDAPTSVSHLVIHRRSPEPVCLSARDCRKFFYENMFGRFPIAPTTDLRVRIVVNFQECASQWTHSEVTQFFLCLMLKRVRDRGASLC
jgi:hypothetical protein